MTLKPVRVLRWLVALLASLTGGCAGQWRQGLDASASVTVAPLGGQPAFNDALRLGIEIQDCSGGYFGGPITLSLGPECALHGAWISGADKVIDADGFFRSGDFQLTADQVCKLAMTNESKTLRITSGLGESHRSRGIDLAIGADVVGGPDAGRHVDIRMSAVPRRPANLTCR